MNSKQKLVEIARERVERRGRSVVEQAIREMLQSQYGKGVISSALKYYARVTLSGILPLLPALVSLSCEMVNGNPDDTKSVAAAMIFLISAADLHDDIIDNSTVKYSKKTVFGKFGGSVALLAGDSLMIQGETLLQNACEALPRERRQAILSLIPEALFEISRAEAKEIQLWKRSEIPPDEYLKITRMKGVIDEAHCKIGGIIAGADLEDIKLLGRYGRVVGMLSTIKEEFMDVFDYNELQNRIKNECPPLPILYALQDSRARIKVKNLIKKPSLTRYYANKLVKISLSSGEVQHLAKRLEIIATREIETNTLLQKSRAGKEASLILKVVAQLL